MAAHAAHYLAFAERAAVAYEREEQLTWLGLTEVEEANLLLAIDRSLDRGDLETACRITWSLWLYWWLRGQHTVGRRRADRCLAAGPPPRLLGRVHLAAATMSYAAGDAVAGGRHWTEAYRLGCEHGDAEIASKGAAGLGLARWPTETSQEAGARFSEGVLLGEQAREAGVWLRALAHVWQGTVFLLRSDRLGATVEIGRGLELARERGDRLSTYVALYNLAQADIGAADYRQARAHLEEGVILSGQTQDRTNLVYFLEALAVVESFEGADERVATLLGAAAALSDEVGASVYMYYVPDGRAARRPSDRRVPPSGRSGTEPSPRKGARLTSRVRSTSASPAVAASADPYSLDPLGHRLGGKSPPRHQFCAHWSQRAVGFAAAWGGSGGPVDEDVGEGLERVSDAALRQRRQVLLGLLCLSADVSARAHPWRGEHATAAEPPRARHRR